MRVDRGQSQRTPCNAWCTLLSYPLTHSHTPMCACSAWRGRPVCKTAAASDPSSIRSSSSDAPIFLPSRRYKKTSNPLLRESPPIKLEEQIPQRATGAIWRDNDSSPERVCQWGNSVTVSQICESLRESGRWRTVDVCGGSASALAHQRAISGQEQTFV